MHRFRPFAAASAILAVVGLVGLGPAAHADSRPAVTVSTPQVTGTSATIGLLVNRAPHAIAALVCSLTDGPETRTVDCGSLAAGDTRKTATSLATLGDLGAGDHWFEVTVTLTDGGTATGGATVTVAAVEPVGSQATCESVPGGTFVPGEFWWNLWTCDADAASATAAEDLVAVLGPLCLADGGTRYATGFVGPTRFEVSCWVDF